jgi:hypothetical protein
MPVARTLQPEDDGFQDVSAIEGGADVVYRGQLRDEPPSARPKGMRTRHPMRNSSASAGSADSTSDSSTVETAAATERSTESKTSAVLEWVAVALPPATMLTALAYWFGWKLTSSRAGYFGIDYSTLGFSTTDYILRSADAMIVPLLTTLVLVLVALAVHAIVSAFLRRGAFDTYLRGAAAALGLVGVVLASIGFYAVFHPLPWSYYLLPPELLGFGVILTGYALWLLRWLFRPDDAQVVAPWERLAVVAATFVVIACLFWASSLYADALGRGRAAALAQSLSSRPLVTVYSTKSLGLDAPGVTETQIGDPQAMYHYRYSGLRLLIRSDDRYFLLSDNWSPATGRAVVLKDASDIRIEFTVGR